jgi:glycosyltransferase involved in cell wall biosynthesis
MNLWIHRDKKPWATQKRAIELQKRLGGDIADAWSINDNAHWRIPDGYDDIFVLFSGGITTIKDYIVDNKDKVYTTLASYRTLEENWDDMDDLKTVYGCCRGVICQNQDLADKLAKLVDNEIHVIPNGVDTDKFNREFKVGFVSAKDSYFHKGYHLVEKACHDLGLELLEAGGSKWDMVDFYNRIDCLVIPSISEGCNNPTLEALAMNKPVITTRTGIADELEGVILVERDVESIKTALRKLSGRIQILEKYTWDAIANQYLNLCGKTKN